MSELDEIIRRSLTAFAAQALDGSWSGRREREAVSLYVLGYLIEQVDPTGFLRNPAQVGIEFPVPQIDASLAASISGRFGSKRQVCKDIAIWPEPFMTCWNSSGEPSVPPASILEWKFGSNRIHESDVEWLREFSAAYPGFVGYAVTANPPGYGFRLSCTRIEGGKAKPDWLQLE